MSAESDKQLIEDFLNGKPSASAAAYKQLCQWIREVTKAKLWIDTITPDEILGDTIEELLKIFREEKFRFESSLKTFVQHIARYVLLDYIKDYKRARRYLETLPIDPIEPNDTLGGLIEEEQLKLFLRVLRRLSTRCQELFKMLFKEELAYKEIAIRLGSTVNAEKVAWSRCVDHASKIADGLK